jgi:predicted histone-like DNA-binding protein
MSIEYDFYRNPNSQGSNKKRYHARVVSSDRISTDELAEEIQKECSLTITDVKAVLIALGDKLAKHLGEGSKVHLDGIGYFQVNLQCKEEVCSTRSVRSDNVEFKSVSYRADNDLKKHLKKQKIQRSQTKIHSVEMTEEEIDRKLMDYFKTHDALTRSQFEVLCTQVKSTAHRILQKLVKDGKLKNVSTKQHPVYMPDNLYNNRYGRKIRVLHG